MAEDSATTAPIDKEIVAATQTPHDHAGAPSPSRSNTPAYEEPPFEIERYFGGDYMNVCWPVRAAGHWRRRWVELRGKTLSLYTSKSLSPHSGPSSSSVASMSPNRSAGDSDACVQSFDITGLSTTSGGMADCQAGGIFDAIFAESGKKDVHLMFMCDSPETMEAWLELVEAAKCRIVDASSGKRWKAVAALLDAGHSVHTKSRFNGRNALHYAAGYGDLATVELLVSRGIDVNAGDLAGMTPLHWACRKGHHKLTQFLMEHGADAMMRVKKGVLSGKLPLDLAREGRHAECADLILSSIVSVDWWPHRQVLEFLAEEGPAATGGRLSVDPSLASARTVPQVIDALLMPFYAKDTHGRFIVANQPALKLLGRPLEKVIGRTLADFVLTGDGGMTAAEGQEVVVDATGTPHTVNVRRQMLTSDDSRQLEISVLHLQDECVSCGIEFNSLRAGFTRRHRCNNCFRYFCNKCSPDRDPVPQHGLTNPVRVCRECHLHLHGVGGAEVRGSAVERSAARLLFAHDSSESVSLESFIMQGVIGKGGFGKVIKVVEKVSGKVFALKTLQKQKLVKMRQVEHAIEEKKIMARIRHPFVINMWYAFQTDSKVYMVLDYAPGGDMFFLLQRQPKCRFPEDDGRFAAAEVCLALEHLHGLGVVHRDLKPENILIDLQGHCRLADFGLSRSNVGYDSNQRHSMVGTPDYMAPEILLNSGHGCAVDWWSLGILIFEMLVGEPPFMGSNAKHTYENIKSTKPPFFPSFLSNDAKDILQKLLQRNPAHRAGGGHNGVDEIKLHPFFRRIHWENMLAGQVPSPFLKAISPDALMDGIDTTQVAHKPQVDSFVLPPVGKDGQDKTWDSFAGYDWRA